MKLYTDTHRKKKVFTYQYTYAHKQLHKYRHTCNAKDRCDWVSKWERENGIFIHKISSLRRINGLRTSTVTRDRPTDRSTTTTHMKYIVRPCVWVYIYICVCVCACVWVCLSFCLFVNGAILFRYVYNTQNGACIRASFN